ncbi:hypothetical protein CRI87_12830 [Liquorilactobacillus satsumensis]|uniref:hypothetical protein n=1 Tax=Liquorilactobacillus satsumensis TaxID=259059 RepID=UPI001E2F690A|nr:hypothetical protein [Liquorilactobacillus satsumensis]MCC7667961.1 hypothetical protein [Liquorilactobacillus satsumensis]
MAKVTSEIDKNDVLGVSAEMKELIESAEWDLVDASLDYAWEDQKKTDTVTGVTWLLVGPRRGDKRIRNKELTLTSDEIVEQNILDAYLDAGASVKVSDLDVASIWPKVNGTFATINIKLSGHVEVIPDEDDTKGKVK